MALLIKQVVENDQSYYTIQNGNEDDRELYRAGQDTPAKFPNSPFGALRVSHHARVWVLEEETHIVGQNKKIIQTGYKGDYLVEEADNRIAIYKKNDFPQYFVTQAGKNPTIHTEAIDEGIGMAETQETGAG